MPPERKNSSVKAQNSRPDYAELVKFLVQPFLESPESLSVDCEQLNDKQRVWIRLAFEGADKGRVYGRGGRNIQAVRVVLDTAAKLAGQSVYLDIYESQESKERSDNSSSGRMSEKKRLSSRNGSSKPPVKLRSK